MAALLIGFVIGAGRLLLEMNKASLSGIRLSFISINFLHFALALFVVSVAILIAVSRMTAQPTEQKAADLVLWRERRLSSAGVGSRLDPQLRSSLALSAAVLLLVAGIWIFFR
jgi:SSS family solute:Na+ symporter